MPGRPVTDLTREDFQIFEDGVEVPIAVFEPVDSPYSVQLLIDRSKDIELLLDWREARTGAPVTLPIGTVVDSAQLSWVVPFFISQPNKDFDRAVTWAAKRLQAVPGRKTALVVSDGWARSAAYAKRNVSLDGETFPQLEDGADDGAFKSLQRAVTDSRARFDFVAGIPISILRALGCPGGNLETSGESVR